MRIEDRRGEPVQEVTVTADDAELIDMLQGIADLVEGKRELAHVTESQVGGPHLVFKRGSGDEVAPIERQMDWWVGPLVLFAALFLVIGILAFVRWAAELL